MKILGIDPGSISAAWAMLEPHAPFDPDVGDVPVVNKQVDAAGFSRLLAMHRPDVAIIETVGAMPKQGVSSSFRFGVGCGLLRGVILARGIPLHEVAATKWKRHFGLDSDPEKSRAKAISYFPDVPGLTRKKDHNRAEALLLALYLSETHHAG
jgi:Holliday junction resolvasome RuvABC endonuclease subunit